MGRTIDALAAHAAGTRWDDLPPAVQHHARLVLLDTLGVMLAGALQPEVVQLRRALLASGSTHPEATLVTSPQVRTDARTAALLNGIAGRSVELCEGHRFVSCQAGVQVLPAVLAVGERMKATGAELLTALVVGYDIGVRLGAGLVARPLAHQNGQTAMLGAIAAGARLQGLDATGIGRAMRIGAPLVLVPSYSHTVAGATALNVAGGMSGFNGALAAELVTAGFTGREGAVEEALAQLVGDGFEPGPVTEELGTRWEITRNHFRLRACCNPIYSALDALEAALAELAPEPGLVERIDVETYAFASVMNDPSPTNYFASKYSLPHAAAALVLLGHAGYQAFTADKVDDPAFAALRRKVFIREDPAFTARVPRLKPARVTLTLADGRSSTHVVESARGDFQNPHPESALRAKFRELAGLVLTAEGVAGVEAAVDRAHEWRDIGELHALIARYGAA
ncbi:MAG: MmgE/PrpD family protein [Pseudomonadota bacterium]